LEEAIKGDVAFIRAWKVDEAGNAIFRYTANNFSTAMARSATITMVEVWLISGKPTALMMGNRSGWGDRIRGLVGP